jgi:putative ABC transport system permease protein
MILPLFTGGVRAGARAVGDPRCLIGGHLPTRPLINLGSAWQEIRLAARRLARARGLSLAVVLTLGLGIGASSALFSVVNSVLLRPLPFEDSDELVVVWETRYVQGASGVTVSLGNFEDWRRLNTAFQEMAAVQRRPYNITGAGEPLRVNAVRATAALLPLLGVRPVAGRSLREEEERPGSQPVCLINHGLWLSRFGGAPDLSGERLELDGRSHAVVGVLPPGFEILGAGVSDMGAPQVLTPLTLDPSDPNYRGNHNSLVFARLRDGIAVEQADREVKSLAARLEDEYPQWNEGVGALVRSLHEQVVQNVRPSILLLFTTVAFVLLLVCVNIATLMLARVSAKQREMAVRAALGARRQRLVWHVLTEALMLSIAGGVLGLLLCVHAVDALEAVAASWLPPRVDLLVDLRVLAFAFAASVLAGIGFGILPALTLSGVRATDALVAGTRLLGRRGQMRARQAFVATQVAMALVLLVGTGLLLRSFAHLSNVEPGYEARSRIAMLVGLPSDRYGERMQVTAFLDQLVAEVRTLPGVQSAGASIALPLEPLFWRKYLTREEAPAQRLADVPVVDVTIATPGFLETMGVPLIKGRPLRQTDRAGSRYVALVNETFAKTHYGTGDPIGRRIRFGLPDHLASEAADPRPWLTVVGVVGDVRRRGPAAAVLPEVYVPQAQDVDVAREFFVVAHYGGPPADLAERLRQAVARVDPLQPVARIVSLDRMEASALSQPRTNLLLVGGFGLTALVLAVMGVYGLTSQSVSSRTREFGLRLALGACPSAIRRQVAGEGLAVAAVGVVLGLGVSLLVTRLMTGLLFGVLPTDPLVYGAVALALICVVLVAAYLPARRASRTDPGAVLRWE